MAQGAESSFKVHDEDEKPHMPGQMNNDGIYIGVTLILILVLWFV